MSLCQLLNKKNMTYGENFVGVTFNPAEDVRVAKIKATAAAFIDAIYETKNANPTLKDAAMIAALNAQMLAVKSIFYKRLD